MPLKELAAPVYTLTAADRCDACQSRAYIKATLGNTDLLFCRHHGLQHEEKLRPMVSAWVDETGQLG